MAKKAREVEMDYFRSMAVYSKVPRTEAVTNGCKVISTRWIDINKGDDKKPNYRSRLVGKEIKRDKPLDLFAATPPLEALKAVLSICASSQYKKKPHRLVSIDVSRAFFYAKAQRPVFIEIPIEDWELGDDERVAKLSLSLYGTRDAAQNWANEYTQQLQKLGFIVGNASPCNFKHQTRDMSMTVHGDDSTVSAPVEDLTWLHTELAKVWSVKQQILGPGEGMQRQVRILNRLLTWTENGIGYEADQRDADIIIKQLGLTASKPVATPAVNDNAQQLKARSSEAALPREDTAAYRGLSARLNYFAQDHADLQFAARSAAKRMSNPRPSDWVLMKRVGRYFVGKPRMVQMFAWQDFPGVVDGFCDSDWAGDREDRKSTSGGVLQIGMRTLKTWSTTQQIIALSSGEAELYAMVKGCAQAKGLCSILRDFGFDAEARISSAASAALGMAAQTWSRQNQAH